MTDTTIRTRNTLALKYFDQLRQEIIEHDETKATSESRMIQIRFLLVEQAQLQRELDTLRKQLSLV